MSQIRAVPEESAVDPDRLLRGDEGAIAVVRAWIHSQLRKQLRMIPHPYLEDLEQDILLDLLHDLDAGRFRGQSKFETYVRSYARYRAIDFLRAKGRRQFVPIEDAEAQAPMESASPAHQLLDAETRSQLEHLLADMPEECAQLWQLLLDGLSYDEMAQRVGLRAATLRVKVHRCRDRARKKWQEMFPQA